MDVEKIVEIFDLVKKKYKIDIKRDWSKGSFTYFEEIKKELTEVEIEYKKSKKVFLEDELGDVFWDYLHLLYNLEKEGKIDLNRVFESCYVKYSQRVEGILNGVGWDEIKKIQKKKLKSEQEILEKK